MIEEGGYQYLRKSEIEVKLSTAQYWHNREQPNRNNYSCGKSKMVGLCLPGTKIYRKQDMESRKIWVPGTCILARTPFFVGAVRVRACLSVSCIASLSTYMYFPPPFLLSFFLPFHQTVFPSAFLQLNFPSACLFSQQKKGSQSVQLLSRLVLRAADSRSACLLFDWTLKLEHEKFQNSTWTTHRIVYSMAGRGFGTRTQKGSSFHSVAEKRINAQKVSFFQNSKPKLGFGCGLVTYEKKQQDNDIRWLSFSLRHALEIKKPSTCTLQYTLYTLSIAQNI